MAPVHDGDDGELSWPERGADAWRARPGPTGRHDAARPRVGRSSASASSRAAATPPRGRSTTHPSPRRPGGGRGRAARASSRQSGHDVAARRPMPRRSTARAVATCSSKGPGLGDHDRGPSGGGDLGHGVLAAVGDHDVGGRQVGPQVGRGPSRAPRSTHVPARGGRSGRRDLGGRGAAATATPQDQDARAGRGAGRAHRGRRGAHRRAVPGDRRPGRPSAVEARQRPDGPELRAASESGQPSVCAVSGHGASSASARS